MPPLNASFEADVRHLTRRQSAMSVDDPHPREDGWILAERGIGDQAAAGPGRFTRVVSAAT
ncbi:hypothetical protein [Streptomyces gobitricini]|uniref:hypothetical protein n=1 Tax=Streptomyces gobitricini TaxID=68211 RepID=UPI0031D9E499